VACRTTVPVVQRVRPGQPRPTATRFSTSARTRSYRPSTRVARHRLPPDRLEDTLDKLLGAQPDDNAEQSSIAGSSPTATGNPPRAGPPSTLSAIRRSSASGLPRLRLRRLSPRRVCVNGRRQQAAQPNRSGTSSPRCPDITQAPAVVLPGQPQHQNADRTQRPGRPRRRGRDRAACRRASRSHCQRRMVSGWTSNRSRCRTVRGIG